MASTLSVIISGILSLAAIAAVVWMAGRLEEVEAKIANAVKIMTGLGVACKKVLEAKGVTAPEEPVRVKKEKKKRYRDRVLGSAY